MRYKNYLILLGLPALLFLPALAFSMTQASITVDGSFSDWAGVLSDSQNLMNDPVGDVSNSNYDLSKFAFTWDSTYIYFYLKRQTATGGAIAEFYVYVDLNYNKKMDSTDKVIYFKTNGTKKDLCNYTPANAGGDPMLGDQNPLPGTISGCTTKASASISGDANNLYYETRFAWADLGITPLSICSSSVTPPMWLHTQSPASGGQNDDLNEIDTGYAQMSLVSSQTKGGTAGSTVDYIHTITNCGNRQDTFNLALSGTRSDWTSEIVGGLTSVTLARDAQTNFTVRITIPSSAANGTVDNTTVTATSTNYTGVSASNTNTTTVGTIVIVPNYSKYGTALTPPMWMKFNHTVYNFGGSSDNISLSASSNRGWTVQIWNAGETAQISSITVAAGGSANFVIKVEIPSSASTGTVDTTTVTATSGNNPSNKGTAVDQTTVSAPLTITPDNSGSGGKGTTVSYNHRVQNNRDTTRLINLSASSSNGWTVIIYKSDGITQITSVTLGPYGGYEDIIVRITIPATTSATTDTTTVTATAGADSATATDITTIRTVILYSDPGYTKENYTYPVGYTVYAKATGLATNTNYLFNWYDSNNTLKKSTTIKTDAAGQAIDNYTIPTPTGPLGTWRLEVGTEPTVYFYVGPDHINANYTGSNPGINTNVTINLTLHDRINHVVPKDPFSTVVQGDQLISVSVSGSATIVSTTLSGATIIGQTVTGRLNADGTATITITDTVTETVTITPHSTTLLGSTASPDRDEPATVTFVIKKMKILDWREVVQ